MVEKKKGTNNVHSWHCDGWLRVHMVRHELTPRFNILTGSILQLLLESSTYVNTGDIVLSVTKPFCMFENFICAAVRGRGSSSVSPMSIPNRRSFCMCCNGRCVGNPPSIIAANTTFGVSQFCNTTVFIYGNPFYHLCDVEKCSSNFLIMTLF